MTQPTGRAQLRAERIVEAAKRISGLLDADPNSVKAPRWRRRLAEYQESLENLQKFGTETPPPEAGVVEIDVPAGVFKLAAKAPGVPGDGR